jgi:hypothetical protein
LREERQTETAALIKVVGQLKRIALGEMVQSFYEKKKTFEAKNLIEEIEEEDTADDID